MNFSGYSHMSPTPTSIDALGLVWYSSRSDDESGGVYVTLSQLAKDNRAFLGGESCGVEKGSRI